MRKLAGALIGVIVVIVGASVAAHELVDQAALRQRVADALRKETGLQMEVRESAVQILPWPSFEVHGLVLRRPGREAVLRAETVHAGLSVLALLHREVRFQDFVVDGADVSLERDGRGEANWSVRQGGAVPAGPGRMGEPVEARWELSLDALHLTNSTVRWRDQVSGSSGVVQIGVMDLAGLSSPGPWINVYGTHDKTPFTLQGHVGALALLRSGAAPWTFSLGATMGGSDRRDWLNLEGQIEDVPHLKGLTLTAQGEWSDLRDAEKLFPHAGLPDVEGVGGVVSVRSGQALPLGGEWASRVQALVQGIVPERVHLHANVVKARDVAVSGVHLDADGEDASLTVTGDVVWRHEGWRVSGKAGTLRQAGQAWRDRLKTEVPVQAEVRSVPLSLMSALTGRGEAPLVNGEDEANFRLMGTLGGATSHLTLDGGARQMHLLDGIVHDVSVKAELEGRGSGDATLKSGVFQSREVSADGTLHLLVDNGDVPLVSGQVHGSVLDLDALRRSWGSAPVVGAGGALPAGIGGVMGVEASSGQEEGVAPDVARREDDVPGWVRRLRAQNLDLHLSLDRAVFYGHDYTKLATHLTLSGGHVRFEPLSGEAQDMQLAGEAELDASRVPVLGHVAFQSLVLPAGVLQGTAGMPVLFRGPVQIVGDVSGQGVTMEELRQSLKGHLGVSMVDGEVDTRLLGQMAGPEANSLLGNGMRPMRCLGLHMTFADDVASLDTMGVQSGRFSATGHGEVRLGAQEITLHLVPGIDFNGASASTPVLVTGTIAEPKAQQDRDGAGRFHVSIGGDAPADPCVPVLAAAREGQAGPLPSAQKAPSHEGAGNILRALGVLH